MKLYNPHKHTFIFIDLIKLRSSLLGASGRGFFYPSLPQFKMRNAAICTNDY